MESVHFRKAEKERLDVFQRRGLRKILGLKATFYDRRNKNELIIKIANDELAKEKDNGKKVIALSEYYLDKKLDY